MRGSTVVCIILGFLTIVFLILLIVWGYNKSQDNMDFDKRCEVQSGNVYYNDNFRVCVDGDQVVFRENR